jgi:xanthine dehydrogenase accessory factor
VVVTTNAKTDELALKQLVGKNLGYLGVMGSSAKIAHLFAALDSGGAEKHHIARIKAPIGASIASHTAEEIAVSIAAELIKTKNNFSVMPRP